jgi:flagellar biosynthesis chaperone FliJ
MQKSQRVVLSANQSLLNAQNTLEKSYEELQHIEPPKEGKISDFLSNRTLLDAQRALIKHNHEWLKFAQKEVQVANESLKNAMIEYEKFKYIEFQEIEKELKKQKVKEMKALDEIALIGHVRKDKVKAI